MDVPEPLVAPDLDLRDFRWMKLDLIALFNSEFNATPDDTAWRAGVTLWGKAWHQVPAGSLPDDDARLCELAGISSRKWRRAREGALHGFIKCSDGRLYHPFVCKLALKAWKKKSRWESKIIRRIEMESGLWDALRRVVFARDDYTCQYCGQRAVRLECDHVVPLSRGGKSIFENLATACRTCNQAKGAKLLGEWVQ